MTGLLSMCRVACVASRMSRMCRVPYGPASRLSTGVGSEASSCALPRGQVLKARRPPPGAQRLGELRGQPLGLDRARGEVVVIGDRDELHVEVGLGGEQRVPHAWRAVVLRP